MAEKTYKPYDPEQSLLLSPNPRDWLPRDHVAFFIDELVEELDLSRIHAPYEREGRGFPPFNPRMMVKVMFYAYAQGVHSTRKMETRLHEDIAFRVLAAGSTPDHATLARFRKRHVNDLAALFVQVLRMCQKSGLVKMGHVALDGTKIRANASKRKAMSYARITNEEARLRKEIEDQLREGVAIDEAEDQQFGERRGDELPPGLDTKQKRLERIRHAKKALEDRARESTGRGDAVPRGKDQYNFTDPESRIMPMPGSKTAFEQQYNAQLVVDSKAMVVVAHGVSIVSADQPHLPEMVVAVEKNAGTLPAKLSADAGFCSEDHVAFLAAQGVDAFIPPDRQHHRDAPRAPPRGRIPHRLGPKDRMRRKLSTKRGRDVYRKRKAIVEPAIGLIQRVLGFRRFSLRGRRHAGTEWGFVTTVYNVMVMFWSAKRSASGS